MTAKDVTFNMNTINHSNFADPEFINRTNNFKVGCNHSEFHRLPGRNFLQEDYFEAGTKLTGGLGVSHPPPILKIYYVAVKKTTVQFHLQGNLLDPGLNTEHILTIWSHIPAVKSSNLSNLPPFVKCEHSYKVITISMLATFQTYGAA